MDIITVLPFSPVHVRVSCDAGIAQELADYFTFDSPSARFSPLFKNGLWDGKIRLFSSLACNLYVGLVPRLLEFAAQRGYQVDYSPQGDEALSLAEANKYFATLKLPFKPHDFQVEAFVVAVRKRRLIIKSPTASGKSLIIYALTEWYRHQGMNVLVVVPTLQLVHQMRSDFIEYGMEEPELIHTIFGGQEKNTEHPITITTWQSIYNLKAHWFKRYEVIIGDEAHLWKAKSLVSIMTHCPAPHRFALTGTLDNALVHQLVLEGLFGNVHETAKTRDLIEQKKLASLQIKSIQLMYPSVHKITLRKKEWKDCIDWLVAHSPRNKFIRNLALSLKGNTLLLFQYVDHGKLLYDMINKVNSVSVTPKPVFLIYGGIEGEERERIRKLIETETDAIVVASFGTFSTGSNVVNLHNVIFGSPFKSKIKGLQSIGRSLRRGIDKESATLFDIGDDVAGVFIDQLNERVSVYSTEGFPIKYYNIQLKG